MALAMLTRITNCNIVIITRLERKLMSMKNMTNYGRGRMTKTSMPLRRRDANTTEDLRSGHIKGVKAMVVATSKEYVPRDSILHHWRCELCRCRGTCRAQ